MGGAGGAIELHDKHANTHTGEKFATTVWIAPQFFFDTQSHETVLLQVPAQTWYARFFFVYKPKTQSGGGGGV